MTDVIAAVQRQQENEDVRERIQGIVDAYTKEGRIDITIFQAMELLKKTLYYL